jgi:EAL domain-containing protein (putative c-di-GMP-specific phosphodiesterase class I)
LRIELTESAIMDNPEDAIEKMRQLRDLSVQMHLDDFGTGYSSLSYLHRLPTDTLKIDRSFVHELGNGGQGAEIISTIVALARRLGIRVSAEGIETPEQVDQVRTLACDSGQGYFFSQPVDSQGAERMLAAGAMRIH